MGELKVQVEVENSADKSWIFTPHKLLFHKDKIRELQETGTTFPVTFDIDLTNLCNHKCPMCNGSRDNGMTDSTHQDFERFKKLISEIKELGARSVTFGGGGDSSLYPYLAEALRYAKNEGLDIGMYTNGQVLKEKNLEEIIDCCTWIRISLDADGPEMYGIVHGVRGEAFFSVINNIKRLVEKREAKQRDITISTCYLIGSKTLSGVYKAAEMSREYGVDYIRLRPYVQRIGYDPIKLEIKAILKYLDECKELETERFKISYPDFRIECMDDKSRVRKYGKCYVTHFTASITPDGNVYPCCHLKNISGIEVGNIYEQSFKNIWLNENRKNISNTIDFSRCPNPCNYESHNELLWDIMESGLSLDEYLHNKKIVPPNLDGIHKNFL